MVAGHIPLYFSCLGKGMPQNYVWSGLSYPTIRLTNQQTELWPCKLYYFGAKHGKLIDKRLDFYLGRFSISCSNNTVRKENRNQWDSMRQCSTITPHTQQKKYITNFFMPETERKQLHFPWIILHINLTNAQQCRVLFPVGVRPKMVILHGNKYQIVCIRFKQCLQVAVSIAIMHLEIGEIIGFRLAQQRRSMPNSNLSNCAHKSLSCVCVWLWSTANAMMAYQYTVLFANRTA